MNESDIFSVFVLMIYIYIYIYTFFLFFFVKLVIFILSLFFINIIFQEISKHILRNSG